jgi:uncharacterized membrane protein YidH (DUF202 family)
LADPLDSILPDDRIILAVERTRVAYDRTMMAWIRTAISLLTFGFGIYNFLKSGAAGLRELRIGSVRACSDWQ